MFFLTQENESSCGEESFPKIILEISNVILNAFQDSKYFSNK